MVSGINSVSSAAASSAANVQALDNSVSSKTKAILSKFGISSSGITTENQAKAAIKAAEGKKAQSKKSPGAQSSPIDDQIKQDAQSLAAQVGAFVGSNDEVSDMVDAISTALEGLQSAAGKDHLKLQNVKRFQSQLDSISKEISDQQAAKQATGKQQIQGSMNGMASYNMASIAINK